MYKDNNEKIIISLRNHVTSMGFSCVVIDTKYTIELYYWRDFPKPTTIYGAIIEIEEVLSEYLNMGWVRHGNKHIKRLPSCEYVCGVKTDCSEHELKSEIDGLIAYSQQKFRSRLDAHYGITSFYENPKDVIKEMAENNHGTVVDFFCQS